MSFTMIYQKACFSDFWSVEIEALTSIFQLLSILEPSAFPHNLPLLVKKHLPQKIKRTKRKHYINEYTVPNDPAQEQKPRKMMARNVRHRSCVGKRKESKAKPSICGRTIFLLLWITVGNVCVHIILGGFFNWPLNAVSCLFLLFSNMCNLHLLQKNADGSNRKKSH